MSKEGKNVSHPHENILYRTESNPNYLCPLFFFLSCIIFIFPLCLFFTPAARCHPACPLFPEKAFRSIYSRCASFPSFFISLCPSCSLLTANAAPLMGAISSLNTCRCLRHFGRDGERQRQRQRQKRERAAAGVVQALSDMTYSQILCAKFELLMSPEANEPSAGTKGQEERLSQYPPSHSDLASPHSLFASLTLYYTE